MSSPKPTASPFHFTWQKIRYGRRYSELFEIARDIKQLRLLLIGLEETEAAPNLNTAEARRIKATALALLKAATTGSKQLRGIAAALDAEKRKDPFHVNLLRAYMDCTGSPEDPPTLADVQRAFVRRFGRGWQEGREHDSSGKQNFSVRKTCHMLGLPLANAKRGRRWP
jgi:hypothetical protein